MCAYKADDDEVILEEALLRSYKFLGDMNSPLVRLDQEPSVISSVPIWEGFPQAWFGWIDSWCQSLWLRREARGRQVFSVHGV